MPPPGRPTVRITVTTGDARGPTADPTTGPLAAHPELQAWRHDLLRSAHAEHWCPPTARWADGPAVAIYRQRLIDLLDHHAVAGSALDIVLNAERVLIECWQQALHQLDIDPHYQLFIAPPPNHISKPATANPASTDPAATVTATLLWLRQVLDSEAASRQHPRQIELRPNADEAVSDSAAGSTSPLQSAITPPKQLQNWTSDAWQALQALAAEPDDSSAQQQLDHIGTALDEACDGFAGLLLHSHQHATELAKQVAAQDQQLRDLSGQLRASEAQIDELISQQRAQHQTIDAALLRLNAIQTSAAWHSAKVVHWLERRKPTVVKRLVALPATLKAIIARRHAEQRHRQQACTAIAAAGLFDKDGFVIAHPALINDGVEPLAYWQRHGWRAGLNPHPLFDTSWYLRRQPGLEQQLVDKHSDPLSHYLATASSDSPGPSPLFEHRYYLAQLADAGISASGNLLSHYLNSGAAAGLSPSPLFDPSWYLAQSSDVAASGVNPLVHYLQHGSAAGRDPCPLFASSWYLQAYPEVALAGRNPLVDYLTAGAPQQDPGPDFDSRWYLAQHPELDPAMATGHDNPLAHYLQHGIAAGALPNPRLNAPPQIQHSGASATLDDSYALARLLPDATIGNDSSSNPVYPLATPHQGADRVLIVDERHPTPDLDSGSFRMREILRALVAQGRQIVFIGDQAPQHSRYPQALEALGITTLTGRKAALRELMSNGNRIASAILSRPGVCERYLPLLRAFAPQATVIYDTVDLHWVRLQRGAEVIESASEAAALRATADHYQRVELANARAADLTIAITDDERRTLLEQDAALQLAVIPNIHPPCEQVAPLDGRRDLFFIGSYGHTPNVEAAHYLIDEIMPRVWAELPDLRLQLVGSQMPDEISSRASDRLLTIGYVDAVEPLLQQSFAFIAPLLHGAGMKGKVGQALSYGLPVITTTIGAEGIGLEDGHSALISDHPDGLAERVVQLYRDPALWQQLSSNGRAVIEQNFSPAAVAERLDALSRPPPAPTGPSGASGAIGPISH